MITAETHHYLTSALDKFSASEAAALAADAQYAQELHEHQAPRASGEAYANHAVRVGSRIANDFGVIDLELVEAGFFHDTVEDQLAKLCHPHTPSRDTAFHILETRYSKRVRNAIYGVTNPPSYGMTTSREQRNTLYIQHVIEACDQNSDCFIVKLSDFFDNAMQLQHNSSPEAKLRGALKYLPLFEYFADKLTNDSTIPIEPEIKTNLAQQIKAQRAFVLMTIEQQA